MRHSLLALTLSLSSLAAACGANRAVHAAPSYASSGRAESYATASAPSSDSSGGDSVSAEVRASAAPMAAPSRRPLAMGASTPAAPSRAAHGNTVRTTAVTPSTTEGSAATVSQAPAQVLLIYNAQIVAQVDHVPAGIDQIIEAATAVGGFLAARTDTSVTVRVPVARFRESLGRVEALSTVLNRNVQAEDVTEQFHDLEVRLNNLRSVQTRLQQFLARASNVTEALSVERELERVGQQIDEIEGRMRFLSNRAAFSTITVTLMARPQANGLPARPSTPTFDPVPETSLPFEVLEQLGLPRLLLSR
ncbi:MAG: DUF4349 domain-containing protein [Myxococcales bacterium]|nr:DUF4349 domain-containing protein [Myxococcales bacterium]